MKQFSIHRYLLSVIGYLLRATTGQGVILSGIRYLSSLVNIRYLTSCLLLLTSVAFAQTTIKGKITDKKGNALSGANVFLKGTYDGASTDTNGDFAFKTSEKDTATLAVSFVGYEVQERKLKLIGGVLEINFKMNELSNELNTVTITAGAFEASDEKKMTILKPLDIVTTAGAGADITGVMQLLPGAQRVGETEGLFVRGGSALESKVVIDGMIVQNPFNSSTPDVQQRGRFNPFMFKGTSFSTGGYSAQYGQALSSVLLLNTMDKGSNNGIGLSINLANLGINYDEATDKHSISAVGYYGNLRPLFALVKQNIDWLNVPEFIGSSLTYRLKATKNGLLKTYGSYSHSNLGMRFRNIGDNLQLNEFRLKNDNLFLNASFTDNWQDSKWLLSSGFSYSRNSDNVLTAGQNFSRFEQRTQARGVLTRVFEDNSSLLFGAESHLINLSNKVAGTNYNLTDWYSGVFVESEVYLSRKLAGRIGLRGEYSSIINKVNLAPRLSFAYKTGSYSQVSLAAGQFYQTPNYQYLYRNINLSFERADHLILNFQVIKNKRVFRVETFYKNYAQLVREFTGQAFDSNPYRYPYGQTESTGKGYAQGFDVFWRDQKSIKNFDYWLTYSFLDTKRLFANYIQEATPTFASAHNVSMILKKYIEKIRLSANATYTYSSGRPYYNPNHVSFLADRTPAVNNVSFSFSHLTSIGGNFTVIYATIDNVLGTQNVFTYRYTADGKTRYAVGPQAYRSFFVGMSISLLRKKQEVPTDFK